MTLLACATAVFMVVWVADASQTVGMSLAERNRQVFPAHAVQSRQDHTQLATKTPRTRKAPKVVASSVCIEAAQKVELKDSLQSLPGGSYRVVFEDGRVEWLTVIDRNSASVPSQAAVITTTVNGERAHLIRVSSRGGSDALLR
jgi:hypothetical protein